MKESNNLPGSKLGFCYFIVLSISFGQNQLVDMEPEVRKAIAYLFEVAIVPFESRGVNLGFFRTF